MVDLSRKIRMMLIPLWLSVDCKSVYLGSTPGSASIFLIRFGSHFPGTDGTIDTVIKHNPPGW